MSETEPFESVISEEERLEILSSFFSYLLISLAFLSFKYFFYRILFI